MWKWSCSWKGTMHKVYIAIGSNIEPRKERMLRAFQSLQELGIIEEQSSIYETAPYGFTEQLFFLNAVVSLRTELELPALHEALQNMEKNLGRTERPRWHEREIDFDILFYDDVITDSKLLTVPHPELQKRAFVLMPLNEIAPDFIHPVLKKNIALFLKELSYDREGIHLYMSNKPKENLTCE
jgi:2-amino-4-hydroxy-6-hydroxymethyldihydropteridine diphosphokinase